jgi:2-keto-4-pentenoate hydratase/2-oxohepta-3-ene-1,7-dioic acid hydratase in catechol pathway
MKLVTFYHNGQTHIGALIREKRSDKVVDFSKAAPSLPKTMKSFLAAGERALRAAQKAVENAPTSAVFKLSEVKLKAPVPNPGKIICIGLNYRDHAAETNQPVPDYPTVFSKYGNAVNDPGGTILIPKVTDQIDYEAELGVVIGQRAHHVAQAGQDL